MNIQLVYILLFICVSKQSYSQTTEFTSSFESMQDSTYIQYLNVPNYDSEEELSDEELDKLKLEFLGNQELISSLMTQEKEDILYMYNKLSDKEDRLKAFTFLAINLTEETDLFIYFIPILMARDAVQEAVLEGMEREGDDRSDTNQVIADGVVDVLNNRIYAKLWGGIEESMQEILEDKGYLE